MNNLKTQSVDTKANIYFDGKVVSHTIYSQNGSKKTVGVIFPGKYTFNTGAPEKMIIVAGVCRVLFASGCLANYEAGQSFSVNGNSFFTIEVASESCHYICEFEA